MAFTSSEGTLLMYCQVYLGKARKDLTDKGIKALGEYVEFKDVLLRVARVTPFSLEKILVEVQDIIIADKSPSTSRSRSPEDDPLNGKRATPVREGSNRMHDSTCSVTPDCSASSDVDAPSSGTSASELSETVHTSFPANRPRECDSEPPTAKDGPKLHGSVVALTMNTPGLCSVASEPPTDSPIQDTDPQRLSGIHINSHTVTPVLTPSPTAPHSVNDSSCEEAQKSSSDVSNNTTHLAETSANTAPLRNSNVVGSETVSFADKYPEIAFFIQDETMLQRLTNHSKQDIHPLSFTQNPTFSSDISDKQIKEVFKICEKINFDKVRGELLAFIVLRRQKPGSRAQIIDLAEDAEPVEIFQAIKISGVNEADAKLHRIYGQIPLVQSIDRKVNSRYVPRTHEKVNHLPETQLPTFYLDVMAYEMTMGQSRKDRKQLEFKLRREREAGMHWTKMIKNMGGTGIVFVFILAGTLDFLPQP
ncbi:MAG: hypothetical protein Q9221_004797 [Calogaya cf. arnoldii]